MLDRCFAEMRAAVACVVLLEVPTEVVLDRLTGRRVCTKCGAIFHIRNIPTKFAGICDACGGNLIQRPDDMRETILNRLEVFRRQTGDLIGYYERRGLLARVDSARERAVTVAEVLKIVGAAGVKPKRPRRAAGKS
jgi:adenylate kinase